MHPHSRMCDDVITFDFPLIIISSNLTEKRSVYLRNAFYARWNIDKLTIIASQILVHQMFFLWNAGLRICQTKMVSTKTVLSHNITGIRNWYLHRSVQYTIQWLLISVAFYLFLTPYWLPYDKLDFRHVWRHINHMAYVWSWN